MSACPGLHCAGCGGGSAAPFLILGGIFGAEWVIENIIAVAIVSAVCGILALAAVIMLMRRADRRDAGRAELWRTRYEALHPPGTVIPVAVTAPAPSALPFRDLHIHLNGVPGAGQAEIIRRALTGNPSTEMDNLTIQVER